MIYENGKEHYRKLAVNGKPIKEEDGRIWAAPGPRASLEPCWWMSCHPPRQPISGFAKRARVANREAYVFDLDVDHEHSHWHVEGPSQYILPAYRGSIWIDKETARVLRIEMQAYHMPEEFPFDKVESATDYEFVRIGGDREFLLPVHAENSNLPARHQHLQPERDRLPQLPQVRRRSRDQVRKVATLIPAAGRRKPSCAALRHRCGHMLGTSPYRT